MTTRPTEIKRTTIARDSNSSLPRPVSNEDIQPRRENMAIMRQDRIRRTISRQGTSKARNTVPKVIDPDISLRQVDMVKTVTTAAATVSTTASLLENRHSTMVTQPNRRTTINLTKCGKQKLTRQMSRGCENGTGRRIEGSPKRITGFGRGLT